MEFAHQSEEDNMVDDGIIETLTKAGIDYELKHNLFLSSNFEWENTRFQSLDRSDNIYTGSIGLNYMLNRKLDAGASYLRRWRDSALPSAEFDENVFMVR